tara:strand:+ start:515 stop:910 length:396 start_codon:yes stop_codon:yes gene_type:complete
MNVEVAIGEIFDKITILDIKLEKIKDKSRLSYIEKEKDILQSALLSEDVKLDSGLYQDLRDINVKIWDTEAGFRDKESKKEFDDQFIEFARLNAKYNDQRFVMKKKINEHYNSQIREQKSYNALYEEDNSN